MDTSQKQKLSPCSTGSKNSFTNNLCISLAVLLYFGLLCGFILAVLSIRYQFNGALECYTIVFTPIGFGINIVFVAATNKSKAENTGADNEGIKFMLAKKEDIPI